MEPLAIKKPRRWRIINRERIKVQFQIEIRDLWIGLFWRTNHEMTPPFYTLHFYVCILPLIPLHITILRCKKAAGRELDGVIHDWPGE